MPPAVQPLALASAALLAILLYWRRARGRPARPGNRRLRRLLTEILRQPHPDASRARIASRAGVAQDLVDTALLQGEASRPARTGGRFFRHHPQRGRPTAMAPEASAWWR